MWIKIRWGTRCERKGGEARSRSNYLLPTWLPPSMLSTFLFCFFGGNWLLVCHFQCVEEGLLLADRNINGSYPAAYLGSGSYCGCAGANLLPLSFHFSETIYRFRLLSFISVLAERGDTWLLRMIGLWNAGLFHCYRPRCNEWISSISDACINGRNSRGRN